ncbi:TPA: diguanylate cyclase [Vibrio parahaemolyticus]|nr:diguanylate cyclase [Vibrio parahaemolyticus]
MERHKQNTAKKLKELEAIVDNLPDHVFIVSESGYIVRLYESKEDPFAVDTNEYIGKHLRELYDQELSTFFEHCLDCAICQNDTLFVSYLFECREIIIFPKELRTSDKLWFEARVKLLLRDDNGERLLMWSARNITERRLLEEEVKQLVIKDDLTNIYNRRAFMGKLSDELDQYKRYTEKSHNSLVMIDIDHFKQINDEFGHLAGDEIIKHICRICSLELRTHDCFGRLGGEEFSILLKHTNSKQALLIAERLRKKVQETPYHLNGQTLNPTISIGITQFKQTDSNPSDILSRADSAMYTSKRLGRNRVSEFPVLDKKLSKAVV